MKVKKIIKIFIVVFMIINIKNSCFAKYTFEETQKAFEIDIKIDNNDT